LVPSSLQVEESERSKKAMQEAEDWDPNWTENRFVAFLKCSWTSCGELVVVSGDTESVEEADEEFGRVWANHLRPRSMFPAPHIIELPNELPRPVEKEIENSFQLFWVDLGASANRMRTSLERVMDHFQIRKFNKTGKRVAIPLANRISLFEQEHGSQFSDIFTALRHVGNLGSHADIDRVSLLSAYEVYEHALSELFAKRSKKIAALSKKIVKSKGKVR